MLFVRRLLCLFSILLACATLQAQTTFNTVVVFGDSLSDTGNIAHVTQSAYAIRYPGPLFNYTDGRFTDGADTQPAAKAYFGVWAEQLAASFAAKPAVKNSLDGGTNYAYGDATTANGTTTLSSALGGFPVTITLNNMGQQVTDYLGTTPTPNAQTLYILWGGANDLFANPTPTAAVAAVQNELALVQRLMAVGATNFMIPNVPPLGFAGTDPTSVALNVASGAFAAALAQGIANLKMAATAQSITLNVYQPDIFTLFQTVAANPMAIGLSNLATPAQGISVIPDTYLLWDGTHPTTAGHHYIAANAASLLTPLVAGSVRLTVPSAVLAGQTINLQAIVSSTASTTKPTGGVTFFNGATAIASGPIDLGGVAVIPYTVPAGSSTSLALTAVYAGDTTYNPATSPASNVTVLSTPVPTTTTVSSSSLSANSGASVTFTATVTPSVSTYGTTTGNLTFFDGTTPLGTSLLSNGSITLTTSTLSAGTHSITAGYTASGLFAASTSAAIQQVITTPTTTKLTVPATATTGQTVTLSAVVTSTLSTPKPTGLVTFYNAGGAIASGTLDSTGAVSATFVASAASSPYSITAIYAGDANFTTSTSAAQPLTVAALIPTSTTVTSNSLTASQGFNLVFTASVTATSSGPVTGSVTFSDGATVLGTSTLSNGSATVSTSTLGVGLHTITASYAASGIFAGSSSAPFTQSIVAATITVSASPSPLYITHGASGTATISLIPVGAYTGTLTLACGTVPTAHTSCAFSSTSFTFTASSTPQTSTLTIATNVASAQDIPAPPGTFTPARILSAILFGPGLGTLFLAGIRRRKTNLRTPRLLLLLLLLSAASLVGVTGCGGSGTSSTSTSGTTAAVGSYSLPITVTSTSGTNASATGTTSTSNLLVIIQ